MIQITNASAIASGGSGSTFNISMSVSGSNPLLVAAIIARAGGPSVAPTWNGSSFTQAVTVTDSTTFTESAWIYYLVPPAPGTYDVVIPLTGTSYEAQCFSLNEVDQSSPVDVTGTDTHSSSHNTELNPSLTTTQNNDLVLQIFADIVSNSGSAQLNGINLNDGQTKLGDRYSGPGGDCYASCYKVVTSAGATSLRAQMHLNGNTAVSQEDIASVSCAFKQSLSSQPHASFIEQLIRL